MGWFSKKDAGVSTQEDIENKSWLSFQKLKKSLEKTRTKITSRFKDLLSFRRKIDEDILEELEAILLESDMGVGPATKIIQDVRDAWKSKEIEDTSNIYDFLKDKLKQELKAWDVSLITAPVPPTVIMVAGVNGSGKTTSIAKLANFFIKQGKKVMLSASDTFRAAAVEQLDIWSKRIGTDIVKHQTGADPAAVTFDALEASLSENAPHEVLMVLDATTGQNAVSQAKLFNRAVDITGIFLSKLDGTAKGGIILGMRNEIDIPVKFIGIGEGAEDIQEFDADNFVDALFD
jgi:fused signal recognition particle receptor